MAETPRFVVASDRLAKIELASILRQFVAEMNIL